MGASVLELRQEMTFHLQELGEELLNTQELERSERDLLVAELKRQDYRPDVLRKLRLWMKENRPRSKAAAVARERQCNKIRDELIEYLQGDKAAWQEEARKEGYPTRAYKPGVVEEQIRKLHEQIPNGRLWMGLEKFWEKSLG
jgi:hypothetical protein